MTNSILVNANSGNIAEYLAQYILSKIGIATPVQRQADIGIDFHCALARKTDNRKFFTYHSSFAVQVGTTRKRFRYGTKRGKRVKNPTFKPYELDWLFSQKIPLFVGVVDQKKLEMSLYSTGPMWIARYQYGHVGEINLQPNQCHNPVEDIQSDEILAEGFGDRRCYNIPLFQPIAKLSLTQPGKDIGAASLALEVSIYMESMNLLYRDMGVHYAKWQPNVAPNTITWESKFSEYYAYSPQAGKNVDRQIQGLFPTVYTLAKNLQAQGNIEGLKKISSVFHLVPDSIIPDYLKKDVEAFRKLLDNGVR